jgi:hypothetical protein
VESFFEVTIEATIEGGKVDTPNKVETAISVKISKCSYLETSFSQPKNTQRK